MASPKLIAFDLDYTLWPFWVDTHVRPPFQRIAGNTVVDSKGVTINHYPQVPEILDTLKKQGFILAVASRTSETRGARQLLELFDWDKYFSYTEIYPGSKDKHFRKFRDQSGVQYHEMLFFDDEQRNIVDLRKIGVTAILVENGVNVDVVRNGLKVYEKEHPE